MAVISLLFVCVADFSIGFEPEDYEVPAGSSFSVLINPEDSIYGISYDTATRIKGTPVVGNYFIATFQNGIADSLYSGIGMTIRLLPEWRVKPIIGAGGSYNYCWSSSGKGSEMVGIPAPLMDDGSGSQSYWAAHVEAGFRIQVTPQKRFLEVTGRYAWNLSEDDSDYWLLVIATGIGR